MCGIEQKTYLSAPINFNEVMRYANAKTADETLKSLVESCVSECEKESAVRYAVCFTETPVSTREDEADFSFFKIKSKDLVTALRGAKRALIFASTIGVGIDRLIKKYSLINPSKALIFQALGAERVETFTDLFLAEYEKTHGVKLSPRFSAGYGDLPLAAQKDVFKLLNPQKRLGLTLNDSLLMSPSKSVTAFAGINGTSEKDGIPCKDCGMANCVYRR